MNSLLFSYTLFIFLFLIIITTTYNKIPSCNAFVVVTTTTTTTTTTTQTNNIDNNIKNINQRKKKNFFPSLFSSVLQVTNSQEEGGGGVGVGGVGVDDEDNVDDVECFIVNYDMVEEEGETPEVVCTSQPDEFAWFNGLERNDLKSTESIKDEAFKECIEGSSPTGVPEWECKVDDDDWKN